MYNAANNNSPENQKPKQRTEKRSIYVFKKYTHRPLSWARYAATCARAETKNQFLFVLHTFSVFVLVFFEDQNPVFLSVDNFDNFSVQNAHTKRLTKFQWQAPLTYTWPADDDVVVWYWWTKFIWKWCTETKRDTIISRSDTNGMTSFVIVLCFIAVIFDQRVATICRIHN